jgi:hypothetical protein
MEKPKKPLGTPLDLTDAELESLAEITPADIKAAAALWDEESGLKGLLDSKPDEGEGNA